MYNSKANIKQKILRNHPEMMLLCDVSITSTLVNIQHQNYI